MLFYLMTLHLAWFFREDLPVVDKNDTDTVRRVAYDQWGQIDFLCRNYVLGGLMDSLYNVYHNVCTAKRVTKLFREKVLG
ncbi:hypothetical protein ACS0TY_031207 [Phlomoides rotata]